MAHTEITKNNFETEVLQSKVPVLLYFRQEENRDCAMQWDVLCKIEEKYKADLKIGRVNVDDQPMLALNYQVLQTPTVVLMHLGVFINRKAELADETEIEAMLDEIRA